MIKELKNEIRSVVENTSKQTLLGVMENFSQRLQMILDTKGSHTEYGFIRITQSHISHVL